jgi:hypothetical protein
MSLRNTLAVAIVGTLLAGCAGGRFGPPPNSDAPAGPRSLKKLSVAERQAVMERANVWRPINTASLDLVRGPVLPASQRIPAQVTCTFVFPEKPLSGMTQKFECDLAQSGKPDAKRTADIVKVKYGEKNGEVYAEVAASRLLWALGFQADVMYPTKVTCLHCPDDPFAASGVNWQRGSPSNVSTKQFDPAIIEREGGSKVEVPGYEGWAWPELDKLAATGPGATRAHLDAFKLLAVFIQHSDSKPGQQEIVCQEGRKRKDAKGNETCAEAWLVIKDLGGSFGKATLLNTSKMKLSDWDSTVIWKDAKKCVADMPRSFTGSLEDPLISEAGRRFLSTQLAKLTERQIRALFTVSNVVVRGEEIEDGGQKRKVTVDDWVRVFKRKRSEIAAARCG